MIEASEQNPEYLARFDAIGRLYGVHSLKYFARSHVCVIGLGGVGSWVVESLARTGIGAITLVDGDSVCVSNTNRQLHALASNVGQQKTSVLEKRILEINPFCKVHVLDRFLTPTNVDEIIGEGYDFIVDAIDSMYSKTALIATCRRRKQPIVVCGGAAGRINPSMIQAGDLSKSIMDPLLRKVRRDLRREYNFPTNKKKSFRIPSVFSIEDPILPKDQSCDEPKRSMNCDTGYGSCCHITAQFGFTAASIVINRLNQKALLSLQ